MGDPARDMRRGVSRSAKLVTQGPGWAFSVEFSLSDIDDDKPAGRHPPRRSAGLPGRLAAPP
jgi:hypothetical protein